MTPLGQGGGSVLFENVAAVEMALVVDVVVDRGVDGGQFKVRIGRAELIERAFRRFLGDFPPFSGDVVQLSSKVGERRLNGELHWILDFGILIAARAVRAEQRIDREIALDILPDILGIRLIQWNARFGELKIAKRVIQRLTHGRVVVLLAVPFDAPFPN